MQLIKDKQDTNTWENIVKSPYYQYTQASLAVTGLISVGLGSYLSNLAFAGFSRKSRKLPLPTKFILEIDFERIKLVERKQAVGLSEAFSTRGTDVLELQTVIKIIQKAAEDKRIQALCINVGGDGMSSIAAFQEFRNALKAFRKQSKSNARIYAYTESFQDVGPIGIARYYLASIADKILVQPGSMFLNTGMGTRVLFYKNFFDKYKIEPIVFQREDYKSAFETYKNDKFSEKAKENLEEIFEGILQQYSTAIEESRPQLKSSYKGGFKEILDKAYVSSQQAKENGLVDDYVPKMNLREYIEQDLNNLMQRGSLEPQFSITREANEVEASLLKKEIKEGEKLPLKFIKFQKYKMDIDEEQQLSVLQQLSALLEEEKESNDNEEIIDRKNVPLKQRTWYEYISRLPVPKPQIAVVYADGVIYEGAKNPQVDGKSILSSQMVELLQSVGRQKDVRGIVLRINSPGGSAVASECILQALNSLRQKGISIVASMGGAAASGGYYIACGADKILAQPATITGSIGVIAGSFFVGDALKDFGLTQDSIIKSKNADLESILSRPTEEQAQIFNSLIDEFYSQFLERVREARNFQTTEETRLLARGKVWLGKDAFDKGLVDGLGGLQDAIDLCKQIAGLPVEEEKVEIKTYPESVPPIVELIKAFGAQSDLQMSFSSLIKAQLLQYLLRNVVQNNVSSQIQANFSQLSSQLGNVFEFQNVLKRCKGPAMLSYDGVLIQNCLFSDNVM